jgi:hypothetical protein
MGRAATSRPMQVIVFTSRKVKLSIKKPFACAIGHDIVLGNSGKPVTLKMSSLMKFVK